MPCGIPIYGLGEDADLLERAVEDALASGVRTNDIMTPGRQAVSCSGMGDAVLSHLHALTH